MENQIVVSVIMPAYNAQKYIAKAIESVLCQNVPLELFIIDDCSTDHTAEIAGKYVDSGRVILLRNERNLGVAGIVVFGERWGNTLLFLMQMIGGRRRSLKSNAGGWRKQDACSVVRGGN